MLREAGTTALYARKGMRASDLLGPNGPLARAIEGYEHRPEQMQMAELVERALEGDGIAMVEAGTGTGKTLAYLVPALLSGKKVIVSTGTKTLQDQIMQRDLPLLEAHLGLPVSAVMMKGLSNYLCIRRYDEFVNGPDADRPAYQKHLPMLREFRATTHHGDRSELALSENAPIWNEVHSSSDTRIGQRCKHFEACFVTRMRRAAEEAQLVVVNHHLFFADLALRGPHGGGALPDYDAVIFDEAHQIEDVATEFFGVRISTARVETMIRDAERALRSAGKLESTSAFCRDVMTTASGMFSALPRQGSSELGRRPLPPPVFDDHVREPALWLDGALEALAEATKGLAHESEAIALASRRAARMRDDLGVIVELDDGHVAYTEARGRSVAIGASPIDVAAVLRERLYEQRLTTVFTSATLSTSGNFKFAKKRLGIDFEIDELVLPSPFEYAHAAALYLPPELPDPRTEAYVTQAAEEILWLTSLTGGGAFVLCTSLRMMQRLHQECAPHLKSPPLLQGMAPKTELLAHFKARKDAVLFASASFWEGVDVPGDALRLVIIDKVPFDVPTDPLVAARCARMEERGEHPFMGYLVPSAALSLKQGFGRLIRTARDRGIVAVLDKRLTSKGYGRVLLRSLPDAARCHTRDEVAAFWSSVRTQLGTASDAYP